MTVTGWDNGLSQDYNRKLAKWFMSKPGAMYELRNQFMKTDHGDRMTTRTELIKRLRITSNMMHMGEKIMLGQDTSLMDQAADMLEADAKYVAINCPQCGFEGAREHAGSEQQAQIDKLQAAARLALDALEYAPWKNWRTDKALAALREAL